MTETLAWADHRIFDGSAGGRALLFGADHASLFAIDDEVRRVLARWRTREPIRLGEAPEADREVLESLRDARILVPALARGRAPGRGKRAEPDPEGGPLATLVLEVAQTCNLRCAYCYAGGGSYGGEPRLIAPEVARRAARFLVESSGDRDPVTLILFGGEPLLNFAAVAAAVEEGETAAAAAGKRLVVSLTTNGTRFTPEVLAFLREHRVGVAVSIDGPPGVHDENRRYATGGGTYADVLDGLALLREFGARPAARVTLVPSQWDRIPEVFEHLLDLGFTEVGIAPASPITEDLLPTPEEEEALFQGFLVLARRFRDEARQGRVLPFANLLDLLGRLHAGRVKGAPCGAGLGYLAVDAGGRFFLCHRLAGEEEFCAGDLDAGLDRSRIREVLRAAAEPRTEACSVCWARSLCAGGCHYENHLRENLLGQAPGGSCAFIRRWLELGVEVYAGLRAEAESPVLALLERRAAC
jgi:uncharacterized protein